MRDRLKGLLAFAVLVLLVMPSAAQETDPPVAVVANAQVVAEGASLVGKKQTETDGQGYYRFANLPPGAYTLTVMAKGFSTVKRSLNLEVGHLPSVDFALEVGASQTVIEVTSAAPMIDVTTTRTLTNIAEDVIEYVPHGLSFQSVIQFAPSARNEPLAGSNVLSNGTGGSSPGNGSIVALWFSDSKFHIHYDYLNILRAAQAHGLHRPSNLLINNMLIDNNFVRPGRFLESRLQP